MRDFWLKEIEKYAELNGEWLTLREDWNARYELSALDINFRDRTHCRLIAKSQSAAAKKFDFGWYCEQALIEGDLLTWEEHSVEKFFHRDSDTDEKDYELWFHANKIISRARRLDDIVSIDVHAFFED